MQKSKTIEYLSPNSGENTKSSAILTALARNIGTKINKNSGPNNI